MLSPILKFSEIAQGAKISPGMSTDLIVQMETQKSIYEYICISFWHQKYPSTNNIRLANQPTKVFIVTSEDKIETMNLTEDSKVWKKVSKSVKRDRNQTIIAVSKKPCNLVVFKSRKRRIMHNTCFTLQVMFHFDLTKKRTSRIWRRRYGRMSFKSSASEYVTIKLDDVQITSGNCY